MKTHAVWKYSYNIFNLVIKGEKLALRPCIFTSRLTVHILIIFDVAEWAQISFWTLRRREKNCALAANRTHTPDSSLVALPTEP
jgi:hypothetical protein